MPDRANEGHADRAQDEFLVLQCQLGDEDAFRALVDRWQPKLLRHARYFTRQADAAKDVAQESWIAIVKGLGSLQDPARFRPWAFRIVANKARDWVRREDSRRKAAGRAAAETAATDEPAAAHGPVERVLGGLAALEPSHRSILTLYYLEGMSVGEIAEALGIPDGTVKSRLFHARDALRARLEEP